MWQSCDILCELNIYVFESAYKIAPKYCKWNWSGFFYQYNYKNL